MYEPYKYTHELIDNISYKDFVFPINCEEKGCFRLGCDKWYEEYGVTDCNLSKTPWTMVAWIYERLKITFDLMFGGYSSHEDDMFEIDGESISYRDCVIRMIKDCEYLLAEFELAEDRPKADAVVDDLFKLISKTFWILGRA